MAPPTTTRVSHGGMDEQSLPYGRLLIYDPSDHDQYQFAIWRRAATGVFIDVSWHGAPDNHVSSFAVTNAWFEIMKLDETTYGTLVLAAHHGVFNRTARKVWQEAHP